MSDKLRRKTCPALSFQPRTQLNDVALLKEGSGSGFKLSRR